MTVREFISWCNAEPVRWARLAVLVGAVGLALTLPWWIGAVL